MTQSTGIHLIAAVGLSGQIGLDGKVPWHGKPEFAEHTRRDLAEFARLTADGVLVMGSTTWPASQKFNRGNRHIVVWRREHWRSPVVMLEAIQASYPTRDIWICGGQKVYELFIPFVDWHHISVIPYDGPADRFLPPILPTWSRLSDADRPRTKRVRTTRVPQIDAEKGIVGYVDVPIREEWDDTNLWRYWT